MALRRILFAACLVVSALCLAAGYGSAGQWIGTALALMTGLAWLLARKYPASGLPLICLLASIGLAVVGRLTGAPPVLMIGGAGIALAVWDLLLLDVALGSASLGEQTRRYETGHLRSLALALGSGLLAVFVTESVASAITVCLETGASRTAPPESNSSVTSLLSPP